MQESTSTPRIRRLAPPDAPSYRTLMLDAYAGHLLAFTASVEEREPLPLSWWEARVSDATSMVFGAFDGDTLVGVAGVRVETRDKLRHKATLFGMYVHAHARGRGVGRALVQAVLARARAQAQCRVLQLTVTEGNSEAQALYTACGFAPFGREPMAMRHGDGYVAKIHMWRDLAA